MLSYNDISRSAYELIKSHGKDAEAYAKDRFDSMMNLEDLKGAGIWMSIIQEIKLLQDRQYLPKH
jgi:hypothetical protein